jgi:alkylation response protein AidB-like acyl-CoA dehydrogenase
MNDMAYPPAARSNAVLARIEGLKPIVEEHRQALSKGPDLPAPVAEAFLQAGFGQLWAPADMGGSELAPPDLMRVIEALSKLDGSMGWCAGISALCTRVLGLLDRGALSKKFPTEKLAGSCSFHPEGRAVRDGEGWRLDGHFTFISLSRYSSVFVLSFVEHENGEPKILEGLGPVLRVFALTPDEVEVLGNWNASGLRASGSHDVVCRNRWVREDRSVTCAGFQLPRAPDRPLFDMSLVAATAIVTTGVPLGIADASIEAFIELARSKVSFLQTAPLQQQENVQFTVGCATARLCAARTFAYAAVQKLWNSIEAGVEPSVADQVDLRLACWNAAKVAKQTVTDIYRIAGVAVAPDESRLATAFRDVYLAGQHINFADRLLATPGRVVLGMDPGTPLI